MLNYGIITSKIEPKILKYWLTNEISSSIIHNVLTISSNNIAPKFLAPNNIAPKFLAPKNIASNNIAPKIIAPKIIAPKIIAPKNIALNKHMGKG